LNFEETIIGKKSIETSVS